MTRYTYRNGDPVAFPATGCTSCTPAVVNGRVLVHEHGCPDAWRDAARECRECGSTFSPASRFDRVCDDCTEGGEHAS